MPDVLAIIDELLEPNLSRAKAYVLAGRLIEIGIKAAPYRAETLTEVADLLRERAERKRSAA